MRRNECWTAVVATWVILTVLQKGSAREQSPHDDANFLDNENNTAYSHAFRANDVHPAIRSNNQLNLNVEYLAPEYVDSQSKESRSTNQNPPLGERLGLADKSRSMEVIHLTESHRFGNADSLDKKSSEEGRSVNDNVLNPPPGVDNDLPRKKSMEESSEFDATESSRKADVRYLEGWLSKAIEISEGSSISEPITRGTGVNSVDRERSVINARSSILPRSRKTDEVFPKVSYQRRTYSGLLALDTTVTVLPNRPDGNSSPRSDQNFDSYDSQLTNVFNRRRNAPRTARDPTSNPYEHRVANSRPMASGSNKLVVQQSANINRPKWLNHDKPGGITLLARKTRKLEYGAEKTPEVISRAPEINIQAASRNANILPNLGATTINDNLYSFRTRIPEMRNTESSAAPRGNDKSTDNSINVDRRAFEKFAMGTAKPSSPMQLEFKETMENIRFTRFTPVPEDNTLAYTTPNSEIPSTSRIHFHETERPSLVAGSQESLSPPIAGKMYEGGKEIPREIFGVNNDRRDAKSTVISAGSSVTSLETTASSQIAKSTPTSETGMDKTLSTDPKVPGHVYGLKSDRPLFDILSHGIGSYGSSAEAARKTNLNDDHDSIDQTDSSFKRGNPTTTRTVTSRPQGIETPQKEVGGQTLEDKKPSRIAERTNTEEHFKSRADQATTIVGKVDYFVNEAAGYYVHKTTKEVREQDQVVMKDNATISFKASSEAQDKFQHLAEPVRGSIKRERNTVSLQRDATGPVTQPEAIFNASSRGRPVIGSRNLVADSAETSLTRKKQMSAKKSKIEVSRTIETNVEVSPTDTRIWSTQSTKVDADPQKTMLIMHHTSADDSKGINNSSAMANALWQDVNVDRPESISLKSTTNIVRSEEPVENYERGSTTVKFKEENEENRRPIKERGIAPKGVSAAIERNFDRDLLNQNNEPVYARETENNQPSGAGQKTLEKTKGRMGTIRQRAEGLARDARNDMTKGVNCESTKTPIIKEALSESAGPSYPTTFSLATQATSVIKNEPRGGRKLRSRKHESLRGDTAGSSTTNVHYDENTSLTKSITNTVTSTDREATTVSTIIDRKVQTSREELPRLSSSSLTPGFGIEMDPTSGQYEPMEPSSEIDGMPGGRYEQSTIETVSIWPVTSSGSSILTARTSSSRETSSGQEDPLVQYGNGPTSEVFLDTSTKSSVDTVEGLVTKRTDNSSEEMDILEQWPVKHSAVVEGDLVLGGLMMVHEREDTITCGPVMPQGGIQALEAMLYTLDNANDRNIVPGVKIGAHILDDCDKDTYGLEMAVDFIKGSISNIDGAEYACNKTAVRKVISGVVGAASSVTSIQVANLLRLFRIPQVSFFSTSPELSNKQRFEYFTRTIPSDHYQVKAMVDIVRAIGWSYVSIIYEESNYGIKAFEELEELLGKNDICIAIKEKLVKDSGVAEETAYDNIVLKLLTKSRARGCIIFGSDQEVAGVMRAVRRCNATGAFSWIGSDGWSARGLVSNGNEPEVEGTLSVQPQANPVRGFEEYFLNLTVENNRRNPWFVEFWEDHFKCRYPNSSRTPYNKKYTKPCTTKERLTKQNTAFEDQLQFVSDAVMAFAYAFRDMHNDLCGETAGLCDAMKPTKGTELLKYLRKVDFKGLSGDKFRFDKNGDGPARYNIIHFKQTEPGKYKWIRVGKYLEGELRLNMSAIQFRREHPQPPESVCSLPCEVGQAKKYVEGERCCWHCFNCTQYQIRHPKDETQCIPCRQGTVPDETHSTCRDIPEEFLRPESGWAIGAMSFSSTGILITLFVCGVFLRYNDTPVVRASGRELSYVLLSGILLCYLVTFALVMRPTDIVCGIQRFAAGFCFTVVYAALLTKTNRISRIFNASKHSAKRPSFISPRSQLIICSGLVFVQILINGVWMVIDPARAMHHYPTREDNLLVCNSYIDASYMIAFAYPIMLIVVCTIYAILTRKIPEAFNESKHIGFTMYTTCVIWLAFVPLYFGTGNNVALRITSMSVTISLSASVTIVCLFSPKLYIILIRPERNVRQSMMPFRCGTTKSSAGTTNASSMIAPVTLTAATCDQNKTVKKHIATTIDCSTQSEYYELEVKDQKNGKPPVAVTSRATQTTSDKEPSTTANTNKEAKDATAPSKQINNNTARIGNGPVNQSDVPL